MGCGSSQVNPETGQVASEDKKPYSNGTARSHQNKNKITATDSNANRQDVSTNNPVPKSISFQVNLEGENTDSLILKHPPKRLQRLDPLTVPTLTAEQLAEKQRVADEKREQELKRRQSASVKASRRRREIMEARQFDQQQQNDDLRKQLKSAGRSREAKLEDIKEKQRIREERAKRAREKAKKLHEADQEDLGILEVEKDTQFNADDTDSWLDGENNNEDLNSDSGERIYSGRTSPKKRFHSPATNGSGLHRGVSSSTVDSFDNAYVRKPPSASRPPHDVDTVHEKDDFFDS